MTLIFSFHNVGPRDQAQGARLGNRRIYPLSRFNSPGFIIAYWVSLRVELFLLLGQMHQRHRKGFLSPTLQPHHQLETIR